VVTTGLPLAVADEAESIAALTAELLADPQRRRELGERGRAFALEHHSPAAWASRLESVYEEARSGQELPHG
jgi:glycosyltransferase involved in cell wall biosynthesis